MLRSKVDNQLYSFEKEIFEQNYQSVFNRVYYIIKDFHMTEDIIQETFLKVYLHINEVKDKNKLGYWIRRIATTTTLDYIRRKKVRNEFLTDNSDFLISINYTGPLKPVEVSIEANLIKGVIDKKILKLKHDYKEVIILKYHYELKDEEIAEAIGLSLAATKSRLYRARTKLKGYLNSIN